MYSVPRAASSMALGLVLAASNGHTQALDLPDQPLLSTAGVDPNVMLFVDNSGSMAGFELGYYDSEIDYADCPNDLALEAAQTINNRNPDWGNFQDIVAKVDFDGLVYFTYTRTSRRGREQVTNYQWGTSVTGNERYEVACFNDGFIRAGRRNVQAEYDLSPVVGEINYQAFTGNQLNYYFSNAQNTGPDYWTGTHKPGSGTRMDITKMAGETLLNSLSDKRIGLATFEQVSARNTANTGGAKILVGVEDVDTEVKTDVTQRQSIIDRIYDLEPQGFTPIGETLSDIARYFISGYEDQNITLHPNNPDRQSQTARASDVFSGLPAYGYGVQTPSKGDDAVIQESCQKNYLIALTDGEPNETGLVSGYLTGRSGRGNGRAYTGYDNLIPNSTETIRTAYAGSLRRDVGSLDDVAAAMYDIDLRPDYPEDHNNITTFFVGGFDTTLVDNEILVRAASVAVGGAPEGYVYPAINQAELEEAFRKIFELVDSDEGSRSAVSFSDNAVTSSTVMYQATYEYAGNNWAGDLQAFNYNSSGTGPLFSTTPDWSANDILTRRVANATLPGLDGRQIITLSGFTSGTRDGIAFTDANTASFSTEMIADLDGDGTDSTATVNKVVNYLRGYDYPEEYRERLSSGLGILGDIVNSSPVEISAPELNYPDTFGDAQNRYSDFVSNNKNRQSVVYVGANDGMLHAFSGGPTNAGAELFAYIPSLLADGSSELEGLYYLTDPSYQHRFYVDGSIVVSDAFMDPTGASNRSWRTVLTGTLGLGGKGIYALDITDPSTITEDNAANLVLWEFDSRGADATTGLVTGDADMGHVLGEPKIAKMNDGRFAVITGNGVNSDSASAVLYILFLEAGADGSWDSGDWIKIDTGSNVSNGLSTPTLVDLNGDQIVDRIYAGDIQGQMWAFDVSSTKTAQWDLAHGANTPLFTAKDSTGVVQPITSAPLIVVNEDTPYTGNEPNVMVLFGTGQFLLKNDVGSTNEQAFYGVWDRGQGGLSYANLLERKLIDRARNGVVVGRVIDPQAPYSDPVAWYDSGSQKQYGWYIPLPDSGERVTIQPALLRNTIYFVSSVPREATCGAGGYGYLNFITSEGLSAKTPVFDFTGDGVIDDADKDYVSQKSSGGDGYPADIQIIGLGEAASSSPCGNGYLITNTAIDASNEYQTGCLQASGGLGRMAWQELFGN